MNKEEIKKMILQLNKAYTFRCQDNEMKLKAMDIEFVINNETGQQFPEMKIIKRYK